MSISIDIYQNEQLFLDACIAKEEWAMKALYEEYYPKMLPICLRYANCNADGLDILHEGFIKVYRHLGKYTAGSSLNAWIKRIMVNTSIDYYRKENRRRTEDLDNLYDLKSSRATPIETMNADSIMKSIQDLPPSYRAVFNLYIMEGYSHKEVAEKLEITESTSRSNLVKARIKLRALISRT